MTVRSRLIFLLVLLAALPVAAWQIAAQIQNVLLDSEQRILLARADSFAQTLSDTGMVPVARSQGASIYVRDVPHAMFVDGYDDEWRLWRDFAQRIYGDSGPLSLLVQAATDGRRIYLLVEASYRGELPGDSSVRDHLVLAHAGFGELEVLRIQPSEGGRVELVNLLGDVSVAGVQGAWRYLPGNSGYRVELSLPMSQVRDGLGVSVATPRSDGFNDGLWRVGTTPMRRIDQFQVPALWELALTRRGWEERLADLIEPGERGWIVDSEGWVISVAGTLGHGEIDTRRRWWNRLLYGLLAGQQLDRPQYRDPQTDLRLDSREIKSALNGESAARWFPAVSDSTIVASIAAPLTGNGSVRGALVLERETDALLGNTEATAGTILYWSTAVAVGLGLLIVLYASRLSFRVRRLAREVDSLQLKDDAAPVSMSESLSADELGDLARDVTRQVEQLRNYNNYLSSLASKLSHELNTPLAMVRSSLDNLEMESDPAAREQYTERAKSGLARLQKTLNAMSEANRLEAAIEAADVESFPLKELVQGCYAGYVDVDQDHEWSMQVPDDDCPLTGAPELIAQLLDKLVDNARSFAPPGSKIELLLEQRKQGYVLEVNNDGPLLPEKMQANLFDSLVSVRSGGGESHLGLGLHIVRLVAKAHGGEVAARNRPDGSGVIFRASLRNMVVR